MKGAEEWILFRRFYDVIALRSHCSERMRSFVVCNTRLIDCLLICHDALVFLTERFIAEWQVEHHS